MGELAVALAGTAVLGLGFALRTWAVRGGRGLGADAFFYLLYVEELRRRRRLPIRLSYYLLDIEEQWYPPGFPLLLACLPTRWLQEKRHLISPAVDCVLLAGTYAVTYAWTGSLASAVAAGTLYATMPTLVSETSTLNSRAFGSLLVTAATLAGLLWWRDGGWGWGGSFVAAGVVLLLSHKLATQQLVFLAFGFAVLLGDWAPLAGLLALPVFATTITGGFYAKLLRGHADILAFWRRNLPFLGAHQVAASPIYGAHARATGAVYSSGIRSSRGEQLAKIIYYYGALGLPIAGIALGRWNGGHDPAALVASWAGLVLVTAAATTSVPPLAFLGEGYKYLKFAAFPAAAALPAALPSVAGAIGAWGWIAGVVGLGLALCVRDIRRLRNARDLIQNDDIAAALDYVKAARGQVVCCIPLTLADLCAYVTHKQVLWGGHSGGFRLLEPFWPILRRPLAHFVETYKVDLLVLNRIYARLEDFPDVAGTFAPAFRRGPIEVYARRDDGAGED